MNGYTRVASYARVSSQHQADERTIDSQLADVRARCKRDLVILDSAFEYVDDGYSGSDLNRPALERLRDHVAASMIDRLYVHSPDRLARNFAHQAIVLEEVRKHGCEVVFLNQEGLPDSPESNMLVQMQGMFSEYERAKILERTRRGRRHAATKGRVAVFGGAPYGYKYFSKRETGDEARWEVDPTESATVRSMFELVGLKGFSLAAVGRELESRSIRTRKGNVSWDAATIRGILINPAYYGEARYGKTRLTQRKPGRRANRGTPAILRQSKVATDTPLDEQVMISVPAIVSKSLFEDVRLRMDENRKHQRSRRSGSKHLLSGLLVCGKCTSAYCHQGGLKGRYYRCIGADKHRRAGATICDNTSVKKAELESCVWSDLCDLLGDPSRIRSEFERRRLETVQNPSSLDKQQSIVEDLRARLDRMIDAYAQGLILPSEFERRISSLRLQHDREVATLVSLRGSHDAASDPSLAAESLSALAATVKGSLASASYDLKRSLLKLLIKRIEICQNEVRIVYKVPPNPFSLSPDNLGNVQHWLSLRMKA